MQYFNSRQVFTARKGICTKVMFLHVSVILFTELGVWCHFLSGPMFNLVGYDITSYLVPCSFQGVWSLEGVCSIEGHFQPEDHNKETTFHQKAITEGHFWPEGQHQKVTFPEGHPHNWHDSANYWSRQHVSYWNAFLLKI